MDLAAIALTILKGVGGANNIESLTYCATRLRFNLKDPNRVDNVQILDIQMVKNTFYTRGQYQIVIGSELVEGIYRKLKDYLSADAASLAAESKWATSILRSIGGQENLLSVAYCATRLRLELSDYDQVDDEYIRQLQPVKSTFFTRGQYQIVVGNEQVKQIYEDMTSLIQHQVCGEKRNYGKLTTMAKNIFGSK